MAIISKSLSIQKVVVIRTCTVIYHLLSAILITMSILLRPWIQEVKEGFWIMLEVSPWFISQTNLAIGENEIKDGFKDASGWFLAARVFLVTAAAFQYLSVLYMMVKLAKGKTHEPNKFIIPGIASVISAILIIAGLLLWIGYSEMEFLQNVRMYSMGWRRFDFAIQRSYGYPWQMAWAAFAIILTTCPVCIYAEIIEEKFRREYRLM